MASTDPLRDLLDRAVEGDDVALSDLVRLTQSDVRRACIALGSGDDVDDLVQESYLRMIRAVPGFRGDSLVRTWLLSIVRHTCADAVRRRESQRRLMGRIAGETVTEVVESDDEISVLLNAALVSVLSVERREAFALTQLVGLSYQEAAEVIGCPVGTVRSRVSRAREDLVDHMRSTEISA